MLGYLDRRMLREAQARGWLVPRGGPEGRQRQRDAWRLFCHEQYLDYLELCDLQLNFEPVRPLSPLGQADLEALQRRYPEMSWDFQLPDAGRADEIARALLDLLRWDRSPAREVQLRDLVLPIDGLARILDPSGLWPGTRAGDTAYVRELANRPGRCMAVRHQLPALLDVPLAQFAVLSADET